MEDDSDPACGPAYTAMLALQGEAPLGWIGKAAAIIAQNLAAYEKANPRQRHRVPADQLGMAAALDDAQFYLAVC